MKIFATWTSSSATETGGGDFGKQLELWDISEGGIEDENDDVEIKIPFMMTDL